MSLLLDSFWRAVAYCLHPRVIGLSLLPLLAMIALAAGLGRQRQGVLLAFGDRVRIEMLDERGHSIFGAIDQTIQRC